MKKCLIIAEIGVNHDGDYYKAKKLIKLAKLAGADIAKFQTFKAEELTTKKAPTAAYQKRSKFKTQIEMLKKLELSDHAFIKLSKYCKKIGLEFCTSFFSEEKLRLIKKLNLKRIKIPSGEITNFFLLKNLGRFKKKIILSTGMSSLKEISDAIKLLNKNGIKKRNITLLHCNTEYPTPIKDVNLRAIKKLKKLFKIKVGYSDHTVGLEVPIAAISIGADVIEKHITLDKNLNGPDHKSSLNPNEFAQMVKSIRNTEILLGQEKKVISHSEKKNIRICRKYLVAKKKIKKGEMFSLNNITSKRVGTRGISPMKVKKILNNKAKKDYKMDDLIKMKN